MTNDILEQLTEDYLRELGYFTQHNIPYRPENFKQTPSDVDIIAIHPLKQGASKVVVVSCKSWQGGLNIPKELEILTKNPTKIIQGHSRENLYREIAKKEWSQALTEKIFKLTGQKEFTFYISVTHFIGNKNDWEQYKMFHDNLPNCDIKLIDLKEMIEVTSEQFKDKKISTPSHSELSRMLQLIKAAKGKINWEESKK